MAKSRRLIVGLGNPGREYEQTRHNIGFKIVEALAAKARISLEMEKGPALAGCGRFRGRSVCLMKPMSYMNRSGAAVSRHMSRLGITPQNILVVFDDLNLDLGSIRIRQKGSAGGHNGMQDIIDAIGTEAFPRLRVGIGNQFSRGRQAEYVLSPFLPEEEERVKEVIETARDAAFLFISEGVVAAMNRFNRKK